MSKRSFTMAAAMAAIAASVVPIALAPSAPAATTPGEFIVLAREGASLAAVRAEVERSGGVVVRTNDDVAMLTVTSAGSSFADTVARFADVEGVARNTAIGQSGPGVAKTNRADSAGTAPTAAGTATAARQAAPAAEPLAGQQWNMAQISATPTGSYRVERGDRRVSVAILDSGIDKTHPDVASNLDLARSRNFAPNIPALDGTSGLDPVGTDPSGHGTAVASLVGAPINGFGMAGVAPNVTLVDVRVGQSSGNVLVEPVVNGLTYAGRNGIDVATMSFSIDPWYWNCATNPADTPAEQAEQRTIIAATLRAVRFARNRGVTLLAASGNENFDMDHTLVDPFSPDLPYQTPHDRTIDPAACLYLPVMAPGVIGVGATDITGVKADYSNYGSPVDVAAPGGNALGPIDPTNRVIQAISKLGAENRGWLDANGEPINPRVIKHCVATTCAYYTYQVGTSVSVPEAAGVAALIVSRYGERDGSKITMDPRIVERILERTATTTACPANYPESPIFGPATCAPNAAGTTFYGHGVVNALAAVTGR